MINRKMAVLWITGIVVAALIVALIIRNGMHTSAQIDSHDFGSEMVKYAKQGRFDEAVQVGLRSLQNQPSDEVVYQQIADVYLIRATKDTNQREQWLSKAVFYTEKSLSLNSKDRDPAGVHLLEDALSFKTVGDLSTASPCLYYGRSKKLLEDRIPLLRGESLVLEGKSFPLAPLREKNDKWLSDVQEKRAKAGCK